jgi:hypothetical protein
MDRIYGIEKDPCLKKKENLSYPVRPVDPVHLVEFLIQ